MNKLTKGLLTMTFAATLCGAAACGGNASDAWEKPSFKDYGAVVSSTLGGFVAETDNYVFFINGVGSSSADNSFGKPIKGSLVAAKKTDLKEAQVVVPELLVASDYNAGVYLFGSGEEIYAYYGTPNKEKDSSGAIANTEMTFSRTRIDGTKNEKLFTVSSLSTEYRMAEVNGKVYIVYYDADEKAIVSYNCADKVKTVIAKTDEKTNDAIDGEYLSLDAYKFLNNGSSAEVVYTMTVYAEPYYAEKEENETSYSRQKAPYNYIMSYKAGGEAQIIKGEKNGNNTYAVSEYESGYLFIKETPVSGTEKTYAVKDDAIDVATEITYTANVKSGMIIKSLDEIYYVDSGKVIKTVLIGDEYDAKETILKNDAVNTLIDVDENYVYATESDGCFFAIERSGDNKMIHVAERSVSTSWYAPEIVEIADEKYILFCDNSGVGNSYVYYADLNKLATPEEKDEDGDGETDEYYLTNTFIGKMPAADRAVSAESVVSDIETTYKEEDNGAAFKASVTAARTAYDELDNDARSAYSADALKKLTTAEKAVKLGDAYSKLAVVINYNKLTDAQKETLKNDLSAATALKDEYTADETYAAVIAYLENNLKYYYQEAAAK